MHLFFVSPMFAGDEMVFPSAAAFIVILTIVAVIRAR
jgi:hypothetical protein